MHPCTRALRGMRSQGSLHFPGSGRGIGDLSCAAQERDCAIFDRKRGYWQKRSAGQSAAAITRSNECEPPILRRLGVEQHAGLTAPWPGRPSP